MMIGVFCLKLLLISFILNIVQSELQKKRVCISGRLIERYKLNPQLYHNCEFKENITLIRLPRLIDASFKGNPKPRAEIFANNFHLNVYNFDQTSSLVSLIYKIALEYLYKCPPVIYYDRFVEKSDGLILQNLFKNFPITFYHGQINEKYVAINTHFKKRIDEHCKSFILFLSDPLMTHKIIGAQIDSRVVIVARSTQWRLRDFLASKKSSNIVNLLVIGESLTVDAMRERPYVLYTHKLYADGLGSNVPIVLTSWMRGALTRPHVNLFPPKLETGFAGHRFLVASANQPPFTFGQKRIGQGTTEWDGIEYRLLDLISKKLNFSIEMIEPPQFINTRGNVKTIQWQIVNNLADIGMSGIYITTERLKETDMSVGHSKDCAAFITLASRALPKYRAIMGPFQWPVWVALTFVYLGAIFPIVYTDRLSLSHLIGNWSEIENMFWYVFGMFTNSLTFSGKYAWSDSKKISTRILIGSYWFFTIIITACYTGSIIAFVTLPAFPETVDSVNDLLGLFFRVGTLDKNGWETWFQNSTHEQTAKLYKKMEFVSSLEEGISNVTQSFFWNYAFLGSKAQLEYLVQSNFSDDNMSRRSALHLSEECFALFQIGYIFPRNAVYQHKINSVILLAQQSGLINKIENEVRWTMQRSSSGKLLQAGTGRVLRERIQEERQLTTADTEGMFLLMGIGYAIGAIALISEIVGGITNKCRQIIRRSRRSFSTNFSSEHSSATNDDAKSENSKLKRKSHEKHKAESHKAALDAHNMANNKTRFGLNLTKNALKEYFGNYNEQEEPRYILRHGKILLENAYLSADATGQSCESSRDSRKVKTKAIVLTEVNVTNETDAVSIDADVQTTLDTLEKSIAPYDVNSLSSNMQPEDVILGSFSEREHELFGSLVNLNVETKEKLEELKLFNQLDDCNSSNINKC